MLMVVLVAPELSFACSVSVLFLSSFFLCNKTTYSITDHCLLLVRIDVV